MGNIGLISPVNAHFCGDCNRIRLTADGKVKPCLHSNVEYALKGLDFAGMRGQLEKAIWNKPAWHGNLDAVQRSQAGAKHESNWRLIMSDFTHFNEQGRAKMVDVGENPFLSALPLPPDVCL